MEELDFPSRFKTKKLPVREILNDCKPDLDLYKKQYEKLFIYHSGQMNE